MRDFARRTGAVVAMSGAVDLDSDGDKVFCLRNGHPMMGLVTGTGCQLSCLAGAFAAANPGQPLEAAAAAVCAMGLCGEIAHAGWVRWTAAAASAPTCWTPSAA